MMENKMHGYHLQEIEAPTQVEGDEGRRTSETVLKTKKQV